jgi:hypothetical protein
VRRRTDLLQRRRGFSIQDASLQESMGPIQDHSREHLVPTDKAIVMARRSLAAAARNLEQGIEPPALDPPRSACAPRRCCWNAREGARVGEDRWSTA